MVTRFAGGCFGSGSLGLWLCLCTGWRDEHLARPAAWLHVSAWFGSRLAGRANRDSHGRYRAHNVSREPVDIRHVAHEPCNEYRHDMRRFVGGNVCRHGKFSDDGGVWHQPRSLTAAV